jgi:branched-chain amino acid transport system permease protein
VLINYLEFAGALALISLGFTLLYSITRFANFSHQATVAFTAYICYAAHVLAGLGLVVSISLALLAAILLGMAEYYLLFRPFLSSQSSIPVIISFGLGVFIQACLSLGFGTDTLSLGIQDTTVILSGFKVYYRDIWSWVVLLITIPLLELFFRRCRMGLLLRAIPVNLRQIQIWGVSVHLPLMLIFGISGLLAGVAGIYLGMAEAVSPALGYKWGIWAFSVAVIGGLGSVYGTLLGALITALPILLAYRFGGAIMADSLLFFAAALVLMFRPQGLFSINIRSV